MPNNTPYALRLSDRPRSMKLKAVFWMVRFLTYGVLGIFLEVMFYPLVRAARECPVIKYLFAFDWRVDPDLKLDGPWTSKYVALFGQSSLWMLVVYGASAFAIEFLYRNWFFRWPALLRAAVYGIAILLCEAASGFALKWITGCAIWIYKDAGGKLFMGMTSLFILPIWMFAGFLIELIYRELMDPRDRGALENQLSAHRSS
jgi:hypothetical protein